MESRPGVESRPDQAELARFARMGLESVTREYPHHLTHVMTGDGDLAMPRTLHPAFFGSFDWHSSVHGHWCLARLARLHSKAEFAAPARRALAQSLTSDHVARELEYLAAPGREGFERPYGLAWLLQLGAELREWADPNAAEWSAALSPLEAHAAQRLESWLPRLVWPVRSGEHGQTAFALGLVLDWSRIASNESMEQLVVARAHALYGADSDAPIAYEPSGHDFFSPSLGEADLMRRVLDHEAFADWLAGFLPDLENDQASAWLTPVRSSDRSDGKLAHLDGLNLSRAWMLEGITAALPAGSPRRHLLAEAARRHREEGLAGVTGEHYAGTHWLGSFAVYMITGRGLG